MAMISSVRNQLRADILTMLESGETLTANEIDERLSFGDSHEVARVLYDMRVKQGLITCGDPVDKGGNARKTYRLASAEETHVKNAKGKSPSADHPWKQATVTPKQPVEPRVTRPLPVHLQTPIPPVWASQEGVECPPEECLDQELIDAIAQLKEEDEIMTEETAEYMTNEEELSDALARDEDIEADAALEASRLAIVDAMLAYAHDELHGNRTWIALERAYQAVAGE